MNFRQRRRRPQRQQYGHKLPMFSKQDFSSRDDTFQLIRDLSNNIKRFHGTLEEANIKINEVIQVLLKVSCGLMEEDDDIRNKAITILGEVFSDRCPNFQNSLKIHIKNSIPIGSNLNIEESIKSLCELFKLLFDKLPSIWSILPLDELHQTVETLIQLDCLPNKEELSSKVKEMLESRKMMKEQERVKRITSKLKHAPLKKWDDSEYRTIQILPKWEEVSNPKPPYKLRPNIVEGAYEDWMHYYDVQFRLLREDFISPLRKGISDYFEGKMGRNLRNVRVYNHVQIKRTLFTRTGLCHVIKFDVSHLRRCNWEHSKRLIFGSLLCLSPDNFRNKVFFAVVTNREPHEVSRGFLQVMFQGGAELIAHKHFGTEFVMVESLAYYEASQYILRSLQTAEVNTMQRFTNYLIYNKCEDIHPPGYIDNRSSTYDIQFIVKKEMLKTEERRAYQHRSHLHYWRSFPTNTSDEFTQVDIMDDSKWPGIDMTELDESQLKAIKKALTQELSVIQGPPGTGKTYIGLKIVQALLKNKHVWNSTNIHWDAMIDDPFNFDYMFHDRLDGRLDSHSPVSPILVLCFTNHALDQFLEGILELHNDPTLKLIRIGRRSRNERIQECNLSNVKCRLRNVPKDRYVAMKQLLNEAERVGATCKYNMATYRDPIYEFIDLTHMKDVIDEHHYRTLLDQAETEEELRKELEIWLGLYDKIIHEELIPVDEDDNSDAEDSDDSSKSSSDDEEESSEDDSNVPEEVEQEEPMDINDEEDESVQKIHVSGEASIEEDSRLVEGVTEMFEELTFENISVDVKFGNEKKEKMKKEKLYNVRRTIQIIRSRHHKSLQYNGMFQPAMEEEEVNEIENVHDIKHIRDRWRLYKYWHNKYRALLLSRLEDDCKAYNRACEEADVARQNNDRYALETAHIIGMTTTGAAKYQHVLRLVNPKIVIVEEAAEVLESHIVSALNAATQHLILIGDHKQLRPKPNEYDLAVKYKLDISLFERLVKNNFPHVTLQIQHRMRPEIAELVKPHVYETLENHESVKNYPNIMGISGDLFFIKHHHLEKDSDLSHSNIYEAKYLVALCKYLLQVGYSPSQITILVTYTGQLLEMRNLMPAKIFQGVRVSTVDNFQGEENDIILLSLVRSNKEGNIGFLREENRVCVALSRAKHGFYCIGNFEMLRKSTQTDIWERIMSSMEAKGRLGIGLKIHCVNHPETHYTATTPEVFAVNSPNGGCKLDCRYRLDCGHVCTQKCHITNHEHVEFKCKQQCNRKCPEGHMCTKLCYEECQCTTRVKKIIPSCGHLQEMFCYEDPSKFHCLHECSRLCPQGHKCTLFCYEECLLCMVKVTKVIPKCGHLQEISCFQEPQFATCYNKCSRKCPEGHGCTFPCYQAHTCMCMTEVTKVIPKCGHHQVMPCHQNPNEVDCQHNCEKSCSKGHPCPLLCSEKCLPCKSKVIATIPSCGHEGYVSCSQDLNKVKCKKLCKRKCGLGHPCKLKCYQECICTTEVERTLKCGHTATLPCSEDPNHHICTAPCPKKLRCGHNCSSTCGERCSSLSCEEKVKTKSIICGHEIETTCGNRFLAKCFKKIQVTLPLCGHTAEAFCHQKTKLFGMKCLQPCLKKLRCGHNCMNECGEECTNQCEADKRWSCPQGHKQASKCYQAFEPCQKKCKKLMSCSHPCTNLCGEECSSELKCQVLTKKTYPCGHQHMIACSTPIEEKPCDMICRSPLACGHLCRGKCSDCRLTRIHKPCSSSVKLKHFCGEEIKMKCLSMTLQSHVDKLSNRILECRHKKIPYECKTEYSQCKEPCGWNCAHHRCGKLCYEQCDRPICNQKCTEMLECDHQCVGLCGEPCVSICPKCDLESFMSQLKMSKKMSPDQCYFQLPCSHIFAVEDLDKYVEHLPKCEVSPLQCPECCSPFSCSYRYGNHMKDSLLHVDAVRAKVEDLTKQQETSDQKTLRLNQLFRPTMRNFQLNSFSVKDPYHIRQVMTDIQRKISDHFKNSEECMIAFLFVKLLNYFLLVKSSELKQTLYVLLNKISENEMTLSYQVLSDLISELYRLCIHVKIHAYEQTFVFSAQYQACATEKAFLEKYESDPKMRIQRADFIRHSQSLDDKLLTKGIQIFESTNDFIGEIECFHPHILNGSWRRCDRNHYYCVPVCEVGTLRVSCSECTGRYKLL